MNNFVRNDDIESRIINHDKGINYTNEKLQNYFTHDIFKMDQLQYESEKINWSSISFQDNQSTIDLIESKMSIFAILDDETKFPKATDTTWLKKLESFIKTPLFAIPKLSQTTFKVTHYAGDVIYTITGFLDKNRDAISDDIINLVKSSKNKHIAGLVIEKNKSTSASLFKSQLGDLVGMLAKTQSHYVRCIKSNMAQIPFKFDDEMVRIQLSYSGMLDTIRVRKAGYSKRILFKTFIQTFRPIGITKGKTDLETCRGMLSKFEIDESQWQIGLTKIFLKDDAVPQLLLNN